MRNFLFGATSASCEEEHRESYAGMARKSPIERAASLNMRARVLRRASKCGPVTGWKRGANCYHAGEPLRVARLESGGIAVAGIAAVMKCFK